MRHLQWGERIRTWRVARKLSQTELADILSVPRQGIWAWETQGVPLGDITLVRLALKAADIERRELDQQAAQVLLAESAAAGALLDESTGKV